MQLLLRLMIALALAMPGLSQAEGDTRPRYSLKQDQPDTGTHIQRSVVSGSVVPLFKSYGELTLDEQEYVRSQYEGLGPQDEPPYPLGGPGSIYKAIAAGQQRLLVTGNMTLVVEVNAQGEPVSVAVLRSADPAMTQFAASVLMLHKYKPALCKGEPCVMSYPFRIAFDTRF